MKLLDSLVEKTLERSLVLLKTLETMQSVATEVHSLSIAVIALARTVHVHHLSLQELYEKQGMVMKAIKMNSLDVQMPELNDKEKTPKSN